MDFNNNIISDDMFIQLVKNSAPSSHQNCTYDMALGAFFSSPKWQYVKTTSGTNVVDFTGSFVYQDREVHARLLFVVAQNGFRLSTVSFNGKPQSDEMVSYLLQYVFDNYAKYSTTSPTIPQQNAGNRANYAVQQGTGKSQANYASKSTPTQNKVTPFTIIIAIALGIFIAFTVVMLLDEIFIYKMK